MGSDLKKDWTSPMNPLHAGMTMNNACGVNDVRPPQERSGKTTAKQEFDLIMAALVSEGKTPDEIKEFQLHLVYTISKYCADSADAKYMLPNLVMALTSGFAWYFNHIEANTAPA